MVDKLERPVNSLGLMDSPAGDTGGAVPVQIQVEGSWIGVDNFAAGHTPGESTFGWEHNLELRSTLGSSNW
jgi:hypothetical protein